MNVSGFLLKLTGWKVDISVPDYPKSIICVAPHTSNWDFILGKLAYASVGRHAGFLMKEAWFFFPLGLFFKAIGGIPVPRRKGSSLVDTIVAKFNSSPRMNLAITPEGTRSRTANWRHGFLYIARMANVPLLLGVLDYPSKTITITSEFLPTDDVETDLRKIKRFYRPFKGLHPEKFSTDDA